MCQDDFNQERNAREQQAQQIQQMKQDNDKLQQRINFMEFQKNHNKNNNNNNNNNGNNNNNRFIAGYLPLFQQANIPTNNPQQHQQQQPEQEWTNPNFHTHPCLLYTSPSPRDRG